MINEKYYKGFEGEIEIVLYYFGEDGEKNGWKLWEGYFENLLAGCFGNEIKNTGLLDSYVTHEGFYDEKPWKIKDIFTAICEIGQFEKENVVTESSNMLLTLEEIKNDLLQFLEAAINNNNEVFVDYD